MPLAFRAAPVRVRVPGTSANLGPGFDCAGLALSLHDHVEVRVVDAGLTVDIAGEGADSLPRTGRHLVVQTLRRTFDRLGGQPCGLEVVCANRIPHSRGLGSSAAAIVAAVVAARALVVGGEQLLDDAAALALAAELEGHPDNVAACLLGGLTLAWTAPDGAHAVRLEPSEQLAPVAFVPSNRSSTRTARAALPATVPHADAAANAARAALLPLAVTSEPSLLLTATQDLLHQQYRAPGARRTAALVQALRDDGVPAVVSGAGPSVLALTTRATRDAVAGTERRGWTALLLDVERTGAAVVPAG